LASLALLVLGAVALLAFANAIRPVKTWWAAVVSWPASLLTVELAPQLMVLSLVTAMVLAVVGGLTHAVGCVGLVAVGAANVGALAFLVHFRRNAVLLDPPLRGAGDGSPALRYPRSHCIFPFLMWRRAGVRHHRAVTYAIPDGVALKLDVYEPTTTQSARPAIVYVHGGGFIGGSRHEGMPMLTHLAANGWVVFSVDYRLSPRATFPDQLVDVKRAVAWVRTHAGDYHVDPSFIALSGGSAGALLSALAALTPGDANVQPGFADADTSVAALVALYGIYDLLDEEVTYWPRLFNILERAVFKTSRTAARGAFLAASPLHQVRVNAPPTLIIYGDRDSLIPPGQSRRFAHRLREISRNPVYVAQIAGGEHCFDLIPSWRTIGVVEAIEVFLADTYRHYQRSARPDGAR
jgi:acetyl esterase/lipase